MSDLHHGTHFENVCFVKPGSSHKDLLLLIPGILVAVIISITTWLHKNKSQTSQTLPPLATGKNISQVVKKLGETALRVVIKTRKEL